MREIPKRKINLPEKDINNYLAIYKPNVILIKDRSKGKPNFEYFCHLKLKFRMKIIFASNNKNKLKEINSILGNSFILLSLHEMNIDEDIPEEEPFLEGNALSKARYVHNKTGMDVFADDTGLEIEALNGLPGVHSARFAGENKNSSANIEKVLSMLEGSENRRGQFRTVIALIIDNKEYLFEGIVTGNIIREKRGTDGFGYDPVFIPDGKNKTFAEMDLPEKNSVSHRARAFEKLRLFLKQYEVAGNKGLI